MICSEVGCKKMLDFGFCSVYTPGGQLFRERYGYCPIPDAGRNKIEKRAVGHERVGQQKQRKKT